MRLFVTVGNALQPFDSLLSAVEEAIAASGVEVTGVCQYGHTTSRVRQLEGRKFLTRGEFEAEMANADVVIAHAGVGTLFSAMASGHTPLVGARRAARGEHVNDHQVEIAAELQRRGRIIAIDGSEDIARALRRFAAGDLRRGTPASPSQAALEPVRDALGRVTPARSGPIRRMALRALARFGPEPRLVHSNGIPTAAPDGE